MVCCPSVNGLAGWFRDFHKGHQTVDHRLTAPAAEAGRYMAASPESVRQSEEILEAFRQIEPTEFEEFCAELSRR